jgi:putative hef-like homing endonuclease
MINDLKNKCKNCTRKDSIKNLLSKDEIDFICNYYGFNDDFSLYLLLQEIKNIPFKLYCSTCNKKLTEVQIRSNIKHSTDFYCSRKCNPNYKNIDFKKRAEKIKQTNLKRYGVENVSQIQSVKEKISNSVKSSSKSALEKRISTNIEKYGVEHIMQLDASKDKFRSTSMANYNTTHPMKNKLVSDKIKNTNFKKYGFYYSFQIPEVKEKIKNKNLELRGVEYPSQDQNVLKKIKQTNLERYGIENVGLVPEFKSKAYETMINNGIIGQQVSAVENEVYEYVKSLYVDVIQSDWNLISPKQLDLYIPSKKLAIEIDGVYWHCNKFKDKNYHMEKTELCESKGVQLLHIFDIEWNDRNKQKIWKSVIKHKLGLTENKIYARKCKVVEIDRQTAFNFCEQNHLQGGIKGPINLGLFYEGELVQVAVISTPRFNKNYKYELLRLCSKLDTTVIGGASKLLKNYSSLISYANRRWSAGNVYNQSGFKLLNISSPNYFYLVNGKLESRNGWQKHKLKDKLNAFDENLTEQENMKANGINWIYDCGNITFYK